MKVSIVYDAFGQVVSANRPTPDANVIVLSGDGQAVLTTDVDDSHVDRLLEAFHVDVSKGALVEGAPRRTAK